MAKVRKKKNVAPQFSFSPLEKLVLKERRGFFFLGGLLRVLEIAGVQHALVTSPARAAARRGRCVGSKPAPPALAAGEVWWGELQLLLLRPQPHKQDVLAHKRKAFTLSWPFPEFREEGRKGRNRDGAVEVLTWALGLGPLPSLSHIVGELGASVSCGAVSPFRTSQCKRQ